MRHQPTAVILGKDMDMEVEPDEAYYTVRRLAVDAALMFSNAEIINNAVRGEEREVRHAGLALRVALAYRFDSV